MRDPSDSSALAGRPVLVVDDSAYARLRVRRFLEERGYSQVIEASDGDEALRVAATTRPRLVLIDQVMRGREGIETARMLLEQAPDLRVLMLTVVSDPQVLGRALDAGIAEVIHKNDWQALGEALGR